MKNYLKFIICLMLLIIGWLFNNYSPAQSVKVNKNLINIWQQAQPDHFLIEAASGAIEGDSHTEAYIEIMSTRERIPVVLQSDGSFNYIINAGSQNQIRIWAQHPQGRRSYGTFNLSDAKAQPQPTASPNAILENSNISVSNWPPKDLANNAGQTQELAFIINVVDLNTGQIIHARRIAGQSKYSADQKARVQVMTENVLNQITALIQTELQTAGQ